MSVDIQGTSILSRATLMLIDGIEFWDKPEETEIPVTTDDQMHIVDDTDRLELLAEDYYGTPTLGWVIAFANGLIEHDLELQPGMTLRIPSSTYVFKTLLKR